MHCTWKVFPRSAALYVSPHFRSYVCVLTYILNNTGPAIGLIYEIEKTSTKLSFLSPFLLMFIHLLILSWFGYGQVLRNNFWDDIQKYLSQRKTYNIDSK